VTGKLVEVALEIIPGARRIGFLSNPMGASMPLIAESVDVAAHARGMTVLTEQVAAAGELASAFGRSGNQGVQAVIVPVNGLFFSEGRQIAQLALAARLPTVGAERRYIEAGVLASYGIDQRESYRRGASYVDRILKGAKPGDLPIEFPSRIELAINLKTAKALGLDLPPTLVTRADEVIE
jgi:putative tryptophan/tyrosine transport system substrate-binding protein